MKRILSLALVALFMTLFASPRCFSQEIFGVANSDSSFQLSGWLNYQPSTTTIVGIELTCPDGTTVSQLACVDPDGSFVGTGSSFPPAMQSTFVQLEMYEPTSNDTIALGIIVIVVDTDDLGDDWTPLDINEEDNWTGCEGVATDIKTELGGTAEIFVIKPKTDGLKLGEYREVGTGWYEQHVVVKNGKVYDGFGPRTGVPIDEYKDLWTHKDDINFGF